MLAEDGRLAGVAARFLGGRIAFWFTFRGTEAGLASAAALFAARGEGSSEMVSGSAIICWSGLSGSTVATGLRWATRFFVAGFAAGVVKLSTMFRFFEGGSMTGVILDSIGGGIGVVDCFGAFDSDDLANGNSLFGGKAKEEADLMNDSEGPKFDTLGTEAGR